MGIFSKIFGKKKSKELQIDEKAKELKEVPTKRHLRLRKKVLSILLKMY